VRQPKKGDRSYSVEFFDQPKSLGGRIYGLFGIFLIFLTVFEVALASQRPDLVERFPGLFDWIERVVLAFFSVDLLLRFILSPARFRYIFSFYGLVDLITVLPGLIGLFLPSITNTSWVRILRIFRAAKIFQSSNRNNLVGGFNSRLVPLIFAAIGFKALVLVLEGHAWWPETKELGVVLGVLGFALAVLLGAKLQLVTGRLYSIEDTVCRIVGALRLMRNVEEIRGSINEWASRLEAAIKNPSKEDVAQMRTATDDLTAEFERYSIAGPNVAGFARDVAYVLHRITARSPIAYERFLRYVTFSYTGVVVLLVPGITGFVAAILTVYILLGMYYLIDDVDRPLSYSDDSLIVADLEPLVVFNSKGG
jgi:hypothetical protein